jgi:hypothetical protein
MHETWTELNKVCLWPLIEEYNGIWKGAGKHTSAFIFEYKSNCNQLVFTVEECLPGMSGTDLFQINDISGV